jgi:hypothetical protein
MIISYEDRNYICEYIPDAISLLDSSDVDAMLRQLERFIDRNGFVPPKYEDYNDIGRKVQKIYDHIYEDNLLKE